MAEVHQLPTRFLLCPTLWNLRPWRKSRVNQFAVDFHLWQAESAVKRIVILSSPSSRTYCSPSCSCRNWPRSATSLVICICHDGKRFERLRPVEDMGWPGTPHWNGPAAEGIAGFHSLRENSLFAFFLVSFSVVLFSIKSKKTFSSAGIEPALFYWRAPLRHPSVFRRNKTKTF